MKTAPNEEQVVPSNKDIAEIARLADIQLSCEGELERLSELVKNATNRLRKVQEVDLPNAMAQAGVAAFTLTNGRKITLKGDVYASIPKDERYHEALDWLKEHKFGDLIKNEVTVSFGKGEEGKATECIEMLKEHEWVNIVRNEGVHAQTLKAWVREQLTKGKEIPMELFGVTEVTKSVIK